GTIVVTGATGGLGKAIVQRMKQLDHHFEAVLTVRSLSSVKGNDLRASLGEDKRFCIWQLDLENLESVRTFSMSLRIYISSGQMKPITAIICNAGFMSRLRPKSTQDGYERAFQINYLGHFLMVNSLLPAVARHHCRVVFVTSFTHDPTCLRAKLLPLPQKLWVETELMIRPPVPRRNSTRVGFAIYARSKMCLMMFMHALQEQLDQSAQFQNIAILAVDPGFVGA
ncbi:NAD(P)-binding protein, partial [Polyplosphaeria fusca]